MAIYYGEDHAPLGYMVYRIVADTMYVKEMVYVNMEARARLLRYINAHDSMVDEVRGNNPDYATYFFYFAQDLFFEMLWITCGHS